MQDDAGKTPETPRWEHHFSDGVCVECQMPVSEYVFALEAALRETEAKAALFDQLKADAQLLLIECDAKTAALLQIVRHRAGNPAFEWVRRYAMNALTEEDHKQDQEWVDALTADALHQPKAGT